MNNNKEVIYLNKSKFGRPSKNKNEKRSNPVKLSFTNEELELVNKTAENSGYKQVSRYLHDFILDGFKGNKMDINCVPDINREVVSVLAGACNNLNQLTRLFNANPEQAAPYWGTVGQLLRNIGFLCSATTFYAQGRASEGDSVIERMGKTDLKRNNIEIAFNGPTTINAEYAKKIMGFIDHVEVLLSERATTGEEDQHSELIVHNLNYLMQLMIATTQFLSGGKTEGKEAIAKLLDWVAQNGNA